MLHIYLKQGVLKRLVKNDLLSVLKIQELQLSKYLEGENLQFTCIILELQQNRRNPSATSSLTLQNLI